MYRNHYCKHSPVIQIQIGLHHLNNLRRSHAPPVWEALLSDILGQYFLLSAGNRTDKVRPAGDDVMIIYIKKTKFGRGIQFIKISTFGIVSKLIDACSRSRAVYFRQDQKFFISFFGSRSECMHKVVGMI